MKVVVAEHIQLTTKTLLRVQSKWAMIISIFVIFEELPFNPLTWYIFASEPNVDAVRVGSHVLTIRGTNLYLFCNLTIMPDWPCQVTVFV